MALEVINIGNIANDGTGDDLRQAFIKVNQNFEDLDIRTGEQTAAINVGTGEGVYKQSVDYTLEFKSLVAGNGVSITNQTNSLLVSVPNLVSQIVVVSDVGSKIVSGSDTLNINGAGPISTTISGDNLTISSTAISALSEDATPELAGDVTGNGHSITGLSNLSANNYTGLVHNIDVRELNSLHNDFDLGQIFQPITNIFDWYQVGVDVDFGTFTAPDSRQVDGGSFI